MRKLEEIEILRAVAILLTMFQHLGALLVSSRALWAEINHNQPFWGGVDLFFCISGFVICRGVTTSDAGWSRRHAVQFWIRRFFRIVPSLWLCIASWLLCAWAFNQAGGFGQFGPDAGDAFAAVLNYANLHIFACVSGRSACGPNSIFWSLSLEEQFYLVLPFALLLPRRVLTAIVITLIVVQLPIRRMPWEPNFGGLLWFFRLDALLLGASVAYLSASPLYARLGARLEEWRRWRRPMMTALIAALMAFPASGVPFCTGGIAVASGCLVLLASFDRRLLFNRSRLSRLFVWIGSRSYSLYLFHMPVYWAMNEAFFRMSPRPETYRAPLADAPFHPILTVAVTMGIFIVADLNYRFVETPFRRAGRRIAAFEGIRFHGREAPPQTEASPQT